MPQLSLPEDCDIEVMRKLGKRLINSCRYITDKEKRDAHKQKLIRLIDKNYANKTGLREVLSNELALRVEGDKKLGVKGINQSIYDWALSSFMVTAISQNNKIDSISVSIMNVRLISEIIRATGFRPTNAQMLKIYINVLLTSVTSYALSTALDGIELDSNVSHDLYNSVADGNGIGSDLENVPDVTDMDVADSTDFGNSFVGNILNGIKDLSVTKMFISSTIDGASNALLTLRIGYITKAYVIKGVKNFHGIKNKRTIRKEALIESYKSIPLIVKEGTKRIKTSIAK